MTDTEIIIEVAKLDGWIKEDWGWVYPLPGDKQEVYQHKDFPVGLNYTTSRDAIIPVIEKVLNSAHLTDQFLVELCVQVGTPHMSCGDAFWKIRCPTLLVLATPRQLCIALAKATGRWK